MLGAMPRLPVRVLDALGLNQVRPSSALCIALASFSVLFLQITLMRILSVVLWYHWAFLSISLAMLGVGAPGVWFSLRPRGPELVAHLLSTAAVLVPGSLLALLRLSHLFGTHRAMFAAFCILLPMLALGSVVCLLLLEARGKSLSLLYGWDLLGACMGALLVIPALYLVPTPRLAASVGFVALAAAWLRRGRPSNMDMAVAGGLAALILWGKPLAVRHAKLYDERQLELLHERWTPTARLAFFEGVFWRPDHSQGFMWGMGARQAPQRVPQIWMEQDGSAGTPVTKLEGDLTKLRFLLFDVTSVGYQVAVPDRVAIIGGGGGRDILSAKLSGASDIDAVEINGAIVDVLSTRFREFSGDVYHLDGVHAHVSEGRSFLERSQGGYDLIQISLIDSWAATAAGAFALSENNLYTLEAYQLYLQRLSDRGILSTSRWMPASMGLEVARLLALAKGALSASGVQDPNAHIALLHASGVGTLLVTKQPFSTEQLERLRTAAFARGFAVVHPSVTPAAHAVDPPMLREILDDDRAAVARLGIDLSPPTDDRPFFFHTLPVFKPVDEALAARWGTNGSAVHALQRLMTVLAVVTVVLFFLPFVLGRWLARGSGFWRGSGYFACIGVAFMLVEVSWLQRFILFLEHPSHATTVVLACLLMGAGAGSLWSSRLSTQRFQRYGWLLALVVAALNLSLPVIFEWALPWPFVLRVVVALVVLVPMAVPMGLFFPLGMRRFGDRHKAWFWAVNGAFGVLASVVSLGLAIELGFARLTWIGVTAYALAWLLVRGAEAEEPGASAEV